MVYQTKCYYLVFPTASCHKVIFVKLGCWQIAALISWVITIFVVIIIEMFRVKADCCPNASYCVKEESYQIIIKKEKQMNLSMLIMFIFIVSD